MTADIEMLILAFGAFLFFTCVFEAFDGLSGGRVRKIEEKDPNFAAKLNAWLENADMFHAVLKLFLFAAAAMTGAVIFAIMNRHWPDFSDEWSYPILIVAVVITGAICELFAQMILPKTDMGLLRFAMPIVQLLCKTVFYPLTFVFGRVSDATDDWADSAPSHASAEDEILSYVDDYGNDEEDGLEEGEKRMIRGILEIGDMAVHEIMTPRVDLTAISSNSTIEEAKAVFIESGHSRIPVYDRSIDEIQGIIYAKDFIDAKALEGKTLLALSHKPMLIPETKAVAELLEEIKRLRNHFAVIIDEYGGTAGIVTFEDIIEEIVGEVGDEYDSDEDIKTKPQLMPDGTLTAEGRTSVSDVNEICDANIPDDDETDTIGGYICAKMGRIPAEGEIFVMPGSFKAKILSADTRRIKLLQIELMDDEDDE